MPRVARLSCAVAVLLGTAGLVAAGVSMTGLSATAAGVTWPAHVFAPYVDTGLSNTTLTTVAQDDGTKYFSLAFVNGSGCQWSLPNESSWQSQISALQAEGGDVSIGFGGYTVDSDGTDLGAQCSSPAAMAAQVESVTTTLNVTHFDFDIESSAETDQADYTRTAQALAQVRSWASSKGEELTISYTLPVLPSGLTQDGVSVLDAAVASGFTPSIVNIMTMDYGTSGTEMGTAANQALDATAGQLESVFHISSAAAYAMLGNTPMIGQNDTAGEVFTLADAATVESYAAQKSIALLSFWSEGRDNGGCAGTTTAESTCSGISQTSGAFTQAFQHFTSGSSGSSTPTPTPTPTSTPTPTPTPTPSASPTSSPVRKSRLAATPAAAPAGAPSAAAAAGSTPTPGRAPTPSSSTTPSAAGDSCAAGWMSDTAYVRGNEVSYGGGNWTANQWNYNEVPGGASGAWNYDAPC